jgi:hypothetical protein
MTRLAPILLVLFLNTSLLVIVSPSVSPKNSDLGSAKSVAENVEAEALNSQSIYNGFANLLLQSERSPGISLVPEPSAPISKASEKSISDSFDYGSKETATVALAAPITAVPATAEPMETVDSLAKKLLIMSISTLRGHLTRMGKANYKKKITKGGAFHWNLLHEAVYTNNLAVAELLIDEFNFDVKSFNCHVGTAVYLVRSVEMAKMLREKGASLNDQRPCGLYKSSLDSAYSRGKLALVSLLVDFKTRYLQMTQKLRESQTTSVATKFSVRRADMYRTVKGTISRRRTTSCAALEVRFLDEEGIDGGGLSVEFINFMKNKIVELGQVLVHVEQNGGYFQLNPNAPFDETKLFGYIVGLSIYYKVPLNTVFSPIMYQIMCGMHPDRDIDMLEVLKETDRVCYNSLLNSHDMPESFLSDLSFPEASGDGNRPWKRARRGELKSYEDLIDFIPQSARDRVYTPFKEVLRVFRLGLDSAVTTSHISQFITPGEIKTVLMGERDYTAKEWRDAVKHPRHESKFNEQYEWFWEIVDEITPAQRADLLKYVTALVSLPIGSFSALEYQPSVLFADEPTKINKLPPSSTCFNQIRLYPCTTKEALKHAVITASKFGCEGFGDR